MDVIDGVREIAERLRDTLPRSGEPLQTLQMLQTWIELAGDLIRESVGNDERLLPEISAVISAPERGDLLRAVLRIRDLCNEMGGPDFEQVPDLLEKIISTLQVHSSSGGNWLRYRPAEKAQLVPLAGHDALDLDLPVALAEAAPVRPLAVLLCDLDHFKVVNDTHGHQAGDEVLVGVAAVLKDVAEGRGKAYRHGGEELAVILPNTTAEEATATGERIRRAIECLRFTKPGLVVTVSVGVAATDGSTTPESLLETVDSAMYRAKHEGRNRVVAVDSSITPGAVAPRAARSALVLKMDVVPGGSLPGGGGPQRHFRINLENTGTKTVKDWKVEIEIPAGLREPSTGYPSLVRSYPTADVFRVTHQNPPRPPRVIHGGDTEEVFGFWYPSAYLERAIGRSAKVRLFVDDDLVEETTLELT